jgi:hypothetical protein
MSILPDFPFQDICPAFLPDPPETNLSNSRRDETNLTKSRRENGAAL